MRETFESGGGGTTARARRGLLPAALALGVLSLGACAGVSLPKGPAVGWVLLVLALAVLIGIAWRGFRKDPAAVRRLRLMGAGRQEDDGAPTAERKVWVRQQDSRAWWLMYCCLLGLGLGLVLYALNHLWPAEGKTLKWTELDWQTHAERLEISEYRTAKGDTWASLAGDTGASFAELAEHNGDAAFNVTEETGPADTTADPVTVESLLDASSKLTVRTYTLKGAAAALSVTPAEVASGFRNAELVLGQPLKLPRQKPVGPREWLDWLIWGLIGVCAYLLLVSQRYFLKIPSGQGDFVGFTPWYLTQAVTGPLIAFVILFLLTQLDLRVAGENGDAALAVNLRSFPPDLLAVPAFLLGFYSRVGRKVLDQIMRSMFATAWLEAEGGFEIRIQGAKRGDNTVESGKSAMLETVPATAVNWHATEGKIDPSGAFTAPRKDVPTDVVVVANATSRAKPPVARILRIVPVKFTLEIEGGAAAEVRPKDERVLAINPMPEEEADRRKIKWEISKVEPEVELPDETLATEAGKATLKVPEGVDLAALTVTATYQGHSAGVDFTVAASEPETEEPEKNEPEAGDSQATAERR